MILSYVTYGYDWTYIFVIIGFLFASFCSAMVDRTYKRFDKVRCKKGITGAQVAEEILHANGIYDVEIRHISGNLTDNFNPSNRVVSLSDATYASTSVAALGVAAHECGHVIQHTKGYTPIKIRSAILPVANLGSKASYIFIMLGLIFGGVASKLLLTIGIYAFIASISFRIITLPVEFNASNRALKILKERNLLYGEEVGMARKVLFAAAMTYVASVVTALLQLLRLILISNRRR